MPLPIIVIAEMPGVDAGDIEQFKRCSDAGTQIGADTRTICGVGGGAAGLNEYFTRAADAARSRGFGDDRGHGRGNDLVSALVSAEESGERQRIKGAVGAR